jgi:hypothetical protein
MTSNLAKIMLAVATALIVLAICWPYEGFATADAKATAIHDWWRQNPKGDYAAYRSAMDRQSNIVEYEDMRRLARDRPGFTVQDVQKIV